MAVKKRREVWTALLILLAIGLAFLLIEGKGLLRGMREKRRMETDPHVSGRVISTEETGESRGDVPLLKITVELVTLDGKTVRASTIERVDLDDAARIARGEPVEVWYAPSDPTDIVIRWRAPSK